MSVRMMQAPQQGAASTLAWTDERAKVLADLKKLEPTDRLSLYSSLIKLNTALFESVRGWDTWLRNPPFMDTFSQEELNEIYANFKGVTTRFLEEDIKWTGTKEKEQGLPKIMKTDKAEGERRYA